MTVTLTAKGGCVVVDVPLTATERDQLDHWRTICRLLSVDPRTDDAVDIIFTALTVLPGDGEFVARIDALMLELARLKNGAARP